MLIVTALVLLLLAPATGLARDGVGLGAGDWAPYGGLGFTLDPDGVLLVAGLEYAATGYLSLGPLLQLGLDDDHTIVAPTLNFRLGIDLSDVNNEFVRRIEPFVQAGLGLAYIEKDRRGSNRDDVGFLTNAGFGAQYWVTDQIAIGSNVLFNGMPSDVAGENFFFSWQLVTLRYRF